jgi:NitT/TauT family transport system permease protein
MSDVVFKEEKVTLGRRRRASLRRLLATSHTAISVLISLTLLMTAWEVAVTNFDIPTYVLPAPALVWKALWAGLIVDPTSRASFLYHLADTLHATVFGFVIGGSLGITLAAAMSESRTVQKLIFPYIVGFQCLPKVAIAPLFIIWFGYQIESKVAISATLVIFPVVLNSLEGFLSVERERLELMTSLDANRWQTFRLIKFPGALPFIFAGLNVGIVQAFLGSIFAEFMGAQRGVGVIIAQLSTVSDTAGVFALLLLLASSGYLLIEIVRACQRKFAFWSGSGKTIETG